MSLQVWLPLISNTENQGCSRTSGSLTNANITYQDGKIGKAIRISNYATTTATYEGITNITIWSISVWLKLSSSDPTPSYADFFAVGLNNDGATSSGFRIEHRNVSGTFQIVTTKRTDYGSNTNSYWTFASNDTVAKDKWAHIVITNDGINYRTYYNGTLATTTAVSTFSPTTSKLTGSLTLGQGAAYCWLNDLRIYDECLSPKEVKEISKALVVHYPLSDQYAFGAINKYSSNRTQGDASSSSWTKTKLANERGYNYKATYTGTGSNKYYSIGFPTFNFTVGHKYCWSIKIRCNKWTAASLTMRCARVTNDYASGGVGVRICDSTLADGKWHEYYAIQTVPETVTKGETIVNCSPLMEFYTANLNGNGTVYDMDFDVKDVQVVESDTYVPYIENSFVTTIVYDTSGYKNNGTVSGIITPTAETPRYSIATLFAKAGYIINSAFNVVAQQFTINLWVYPNTATSQHFLFGLFTSWANDGIGVFRNANSVQYNCVIKSGAENSYLNKQLNTTINTWNMLSIIYTGTQYILYLNGVLNSTTTYGLSGTVALTNLMIGNSKYNSTPSSENEEAIISDFRLYATALSDADILELYNKPVSINKHSMMTQGEFVEES